MGQKRLTSSNYTQQWPDFLKKAASKAVECKEDIYKPLVIPGSELKELISTYPIFEVADNYDEQLAELFISENAQLYKAVREVQSSSIRDYLKKHYSDMDAWRKGNWAYYPWNATLVHLLEEELWWKLRTVRNQILMTNEEQKKYTSFKVGCAGMSVGSNGAAALVLTSGSKDLKIADGAVLSGSNLNRLRGKVSDIGLNKAIVMARQFYELNPYLTLEAMSENLSADNIENFFDKPWPLNLIVDEIDDLETKILIRLEAKKRQIPVVMVTEPGDTVILDVERYDLDPNLPIFHGLVPGFEEVLKKDKLNQREFVKFAMKIIGVKNLPLRDQKAMIKVGSQIPSPPQLGSTAMLAGGVIAFAIRKIATGDNFKSGRQVLNLEHEFIKGAKSIQNRLAHSKHSKIMTKAMRSM